MNNNKQSQGILQQFPLIGGNPLYDYHFGFFETDEPFHHFKLSFNRNSDLYASGIEPELIIVVDRKYYTDVWKIEEKRFCIGGRNDYDEQRLSWCFTLDDSDMVRIAEADCITAIEIQKKRFRLDLLADAPDIWSSFFRAGVAECINAQKDSRELREFCLQYGLAKKKLELEKAVFTNEINPAYLADLMSRPDSSIDMII